MNDDDNSACKPSYKLMNEEQIERIHEATLDILENVGVKIDHDGGIALMKEKGCDVKEGSIVRIPRTIVEECIKSTPSSIKMFNRKGEEAMNLEGRNTYFGLGTDLIKTYDLETNEVRLSLLKDVKNAAKIADYCKNVDFIASYALPSDVPTNTMYIECFKAEMENSTKPIFFTAAGREDLEVIIKMAELVAGGPDELKKKPFLIHYSEPIAPLMHSKGAVSKVLLCAEKSVPICYIPTVLLGASGPVTLAGGITQANAEALSGIVLHQLGNKGAPIVSGWAVVPLDMKSTTYCYGSPEVRLTNNAFSDIYHHYKIPMWSIVGTDSHCLDQQASMEHAFSNLMAALDGANLVHDIGYLGQGLLGNPAAIVMCDEMISYIKRIIRGFDINDETIALDLIKKVGPGGEFLSERHTLKHFRKELWRPSFMNREIYQNWLDEGSMTYGEKVMEKTREILKIHAPDLLDEQIIKKLDKIVERAREKLENFKFVA
ncbi:MAG: trimethylamine methyltransferase family protein [Candidatus Hodarchaeota archaeon]